MWNYDENETEDDNIPANNLLNRVFGNALIADHLISYLSLQDMKNLRLTSKIFPCIWTYKNFLWRAVVSGFDNEAITCGVNWKNVRIHLNTNITVKEALKDLLEKYVEYLWLTGNGIHLKEFINENSRKGKAVFEKLSYLKTNTTTLNGFKLEDFPFMAENLQRLNLHLNVKCTKLEEMSVLLTNLSIIAEKCKELKEFKLTYYNFRNPDITWKEIQKRRIQILKANAKSIDSVELEATSDVDQLGGVTFPSLKHCTLHGQWTILTPIFLKSQPLLESFQFDCWKGYCPVSVLGTVADVSKNIKKLVIYATGFNSNDNNSSPWKFLSQMRCLEKIEILEGSDTDIYIHLWQSMPASLKKIHMSGVRRINGQPNISTLSNFPFRGLTELELHSGNQIEDVDLQQICRKLSKLTVLKFSWCPQCTDYGITGIPLPGTEFFPVDISINRLKELQMLTINYCEKITNLIEAVLCFPYLTKLDLRDNKSLESTASFKEKLWSQNPRLEVLHV